jgi:hypothetical protein
MALAEAQGLRIVYQEELHFYKLASIHGNALMIWDCQNILVGTHSDDLPIKAYGADLITCNIENFYLLLVGNGHPFVRWGNPNDLPPLFLPWAVLDLSVVELDAESRWIGIGDEQVIHIYKLDSLIFEERSIFGGILELQLDNHGVINLDAFNQISRWTCVQEATIFEERSRIINRVLGVWGDYFLGLWLFGDFILNLLPTDRVFTFIHLVAFFIVFVVVVEVDDVLALDAIVLDLHLVIFLYVVNVLRDSLLVLIILAILFGDSVKGLPDLVDSLQWKLLNYNNLLLILVVPDKQFLGWASHQNTVLYHLNQRNVAAVLDKLRQSIFPSVVQ